jgi:hypothetical protein
MLVGSLEGRTCLDGPAVRLAIDLWVPGSSLVSAALEIAGHTRGKYFAEGLKLAYSKWVLGEVAHHTLAHEAVPVVDLASHLAPYADCPSAAVARVEVPELEGYGVDFLTSRT